MPEQLYRLDALLDMQSTTNNTKSAEGKQIKQKKMDK